MSELLAPRWHDLSKIYAMEFAGMTAQPTDLSKLIAVREQLLEELHKGLTDTERAFLIAFKAGKPDWSIFPYPHVSAFPAIAWKQQNLAKMNAAKHSVTIKKLEQVLRR